MKNFEGIKLKFALAKEGRKKFHQAFGLNTFRIRQRVKLASAGLDQFLIGATVDLSKAKRIKNIVEKINRRP